MSKTNETMKQTQSRQELADRFSDHIKDDPTLTEVLEAFDPDELYVYKSRRSNLLMNWNQEDNRHIDDCVWSHGHWEGSVPRWINELFEAAGIEYR